MSFEGMSCSIEMDGKPHFFLSYVSLIFFVNLVLGIFFFVFVFKEKHL